ncbi:MAG: response regulator [Desulfatibacillaceae bacterium]
MSKILVIDDEKATLSMFRLFLNALGYEVLLAENGASGIDIFLEEKPRIVLTDIKMPGMDGFAVLERIKEIDGETEVIMLTGHGDTDLARRAMNMSATGFIHKPVDKSMLEDVLKRAEGRLSGSDNG